MPAEHFLARDRSHDRWNRDLPPALVVASGDVVHFQCHEATGGQITRATTPEEFARRDAGRVHTLTGPVFVGEAQPGDVLQVDILDVQHGGWGWSGITPGFGFLSERFTENYLFIWELEERVSRSLAPAVGPRAPCCGVMGGAPTAPGEFRTREPGPFGGNLDVRQLTAGATLYLPVGVEGALFSCGDAHAAQGDGEVCLNGIETPSDVRLRLTVRRDFALTAPMAETPATPAAPSDATAGSWLMIESDRDPVRAAQRALGRMVDFISGRFGLTPENAYVLCSAGMDLKFSQVVNMPVFTVSAVLPKHLFPGR